MQKLEYFLFHSTRKAEQSSKPSTKRAKQSKFFFIFMKCVNIKFEIEIHNLTNLNTLPPSSIWSITLCTCLLSIFLSELMN